MSEPSDVVDAPPPSADAGGSEERFQLVAAGANDGVWDWDLRRNRLYFSKRLKASLGHEGLDAEPEPGDWMSRIHPDDQLAVRRAIEALVYGHHDRFENEHRLRHKDGSYRWVLLRAALGRDAMGKPVRLAGSLTDITERRRAEAALAERERRFRALIEHGSDLISLIGADGTFTYFGPSVTRILGYQPAELIGRHALDLVHPDDRALAIEKLTDLTSHPGASAIGASRCRHKDGSWRWLEAIGTNFLAEPSVQAIIVNSRDVTDRMQAEQELRDREERLRKIFEEGPLGMVTVGSDQRFIEVNNLFCRITGYARTELIGRPFTEITHPDDLAVDRQLVRAVFAGEIPSFEREKRYLRRDGEAVWVRVTVSVIRDVHGAPLHAIGMVQDITGRKRAEAEAQERFVELAHVLRVATVNEMAASLAHELNQPLAAIINYARGCARRLEAGQSGEGLARVQEDIVAEALRAAEVIRRLRQFLRKEPPQREVLNVNDVVRGVIDLLGAEARAHRALVHVDLGAGVLPVRGDRIQIEQVVLNLIRNGFEAMDGAAQPDRRELYVSTLLAAPELIEVAVRDTGAGLPAAAAGRLFTPFFTTKPAGLGMGLSISRLIIEAHGGRLWAAPDAERGTTFRFTLPVCRPGDAATG